MASLVERIAASDVRDLPDWRVAEVLNAPDQTLPVVHIDVSTDDVREVLLATGAWSKIIMTAEPGSGAPVELRGLCILVRDTMTYTRTLRLSDPTRYTAMHQAVSGLLTAGVVNQATVNALLALADRRQSWAEANGVTVDARTIGLARGGVG